LLTANPIITEFQASNDSTINDGFGNDSDWIEIHNAGDTAVDLQGYHLTDNAGFLNKWTFTTSTILQPSEYLVVFASGQDTIDPFGYQHTGFKLSAGGEYLALVAPDHTVLSEFGSATEDYPAQFTDTSFGTVGSTLLTGDTIVDYRIPTVADGGLGTTWTTVGFDASAAGFQSGAAAIGYENNPNSGTSYSSRIQTTVPAGTDGVYVRHEFNLEDASALTSLDLNLQSDDGVAVYLNGQQIIAERTPSPLLWNSEATTGNPDIDVIEGVDYPLSNFLGLLQDGPNVLAIHALNFNNGGVSSDFLIVPTLTTSGVGAESGYLTTPTPGAANSDLFPQGPLILDVSPSREVPVAGQSLVIEAEISPFMDPINTSTVSMTYRRMFQNEVTVTMRDDGVGADATANDGIYTAVIPGSAIRAGELIRWFVSVDDTGGLTSRAPRFLDPIDSAEYFGAVVPDPTASTDVPVVHLFVEDTDAIETDEGTRASLQFRGVFYDNIQVDVHGQSTRSFPKKSIDVDSNSGEKFDIADGVGKASDFNLLTNYGDQTKIRHPLAYDVFAEAGLPSSIAYTVSLHRNGQFYGLYDFVEESDEEQLERYGFDETNNLYKVNNNLSSAFDQVDQKAGVDTSRDDFQVVLDGNALGNNSNAASRNWDWDHLDMADLVNYMAINHFIQNTDFGHKNMYWYHDNSGTGLWSVLPWDVDLTFGHKWNPTDLYFDNNLNTASELNNGGWNNIMRRLTANPEFKEMHDARLRTLMDQFLGEPGTDIADSWLYQEIATRSAVLADEAAADAAAWPNTVLNPGFPSAFPFTPAQAADQQLDTWLPTRRSLLESIGSIPDGHGDSSDIRIGTVEYNPAGNLNQQYLVIENHENFAVDISGWTINGDITHTFKAGTVLAANDEIHIAADVQGFLNRSASPRGGQQRFVQGANSGTWNPGGGIVDLANVNGAVIDSDTYGVTGDFNGDGVYSCSDIDPLSILASSQTFVATHDMNADGTVDQDDVTLWLNRAGFVNLGVGESYQYGDANLDGLIDEQDFGVWNANRFTTGTTWCDADFDTDGVVDNSDFNLWNLNKYTHDNVAVALATVAEFRVPRAAPATQVVDTAFVEDTGDTTDTTTEATNPVLATVATAVADQSNQSAPRAASSVIITAPDAAADVQDAAAQRESLTVPFSTPSSTSSAIDSVLDEADEEEATDDPWWIDGRWDFLG